MARKKTRRFFSEKDYQDWLSGSGKYECQYNRFLKQIEYEHEVYDWLNETWPESADEIEVWACGVDAQAINAPYRDTDAI